MNTANDTPLAHKVPDACRRLGVSRSLLYDLIKTGELKAIKVANRTLIPESELQRFVAERLAAA
jgi:excisionase family DNA binding protein